MAMKVDSAAKRRARKRLHYALSPWFPELDAEAMAGAVLERGPECQPGIEIEMRLVEQRRAS